MVISVQDSQSSGNVIHMLSRGVRLCHNDLGQHNILVNTKTLKIKYIIDWEFSGSFRLGSKTLFGSEQGPTTDGEDWLMGLVGNCEVVSCNLTFPVNDDETYWASVG